MRSMEMARSGATPRGNLGLWLAVMCGESVREQCEPICNLLRYKMHLPGRKKARRIAPLLIALLIALLKTCDSKLLAKADPWSRHGKPFRVGARPMEKEKGL